MERSFRIFLTITASLILIVACGDDDTPADSGTDRGVDASTDAPMSDERVQEDMAQDTGEDRGTGSCEVDNGGCDPLVLCSTRDNGTIACGRCPSGYSGTGGKAAPT